MTEFWIITAGLTILAILFVIVPLRLSGSRGQAGLSHENQNIEIFKERAAEIKRDRDQALLSDAEYSQQLTELESKLISDTKSAHAKQSSKPNRWFSIVMAVIILAIPFSAYILYLELGASTKVYQASGLAGKPPTGTPDSGEVNQSQDINVLLSRLHQKLVDDPDRLEGWSLLARTSMSANRFDLAVEAYKQIIRLLDLENEDTAPVYGLLAQAQYYISNAELNTLVQSALDEAFERDPNEINSLGLLAIHHYSNDDFKTAISYWEKF